MRRFEEWTHPDICEAVFDQPRLVEHSRYYASLSPYIERFDRDRIHVLLLEDLSRDPEAELARCFGFLRVDPSVDLPQPFRARNPSGELRKRGTLLRTLDELKILQPLKKALPRSARPGVRRLFTRREVYEPDWDEDVKNEVIEAVRVDAEKFLAFCDKPADSWDLTA